MHPVAGGAEGSPAAAVAAAGDALVAAAGRCGRREYRLTVAGTRMILVPGLTGEGLVDLDALREGFQRIAHAIG